MCLIAFDWRPHKDTTKEEEISLLKRPSLLLVANRDEFYRRPSRNASFWKQDEMMIDNNDNDDDDDFHQNEIYAGKDLLQGGTWLGCSSNGRFATITNFHDKEDQNRQYPRSRGEIVSMFISSKQRHKHDESANVKSNDNSYYWSAREFATEFLKDKLDEYSGFSVLLFDGKSLICCTNRNKKYCDRQDFFWELPPGLYGLSNHLLDTPWPKIIKAKEVLGEARQVLSNNDQTKKYNGTLDEEVVEKLLIGFEDTTVFDYNNQVSSLEGDEVYIRCSLCVRLKGYGTRTTTIVCYDDVTKAFEFIEKNYETPYDQKSFSREFIKVYTKESNGESTTEKKHGRQNDRNKSILVKSFDTDTI
jgi:uncharacterized protein with NRDE domain